MNLFSAIFVGFFLGTTTAIVAIKDDNVPRVVSVTRHATKECHIDPLSPCVAETMVIRNPKFKPIEAVISCGTDLDEQVVVVPARTQLTLEIELTIPPNEDPACKMKSWSFVDGLQ